ncbi:Transformation/transcription domain-associated protein, partial [Stegodyphus mimosarum]
MVASSLCIERWKSLPIPFSGRHYSLLQAAQKIREFDKAKDFQTDIEMNDISEHSIFSLISKMQSYWCSEHPLINEDFSFWSDFISFRQKQFENFCTRNQNDSTMKLLHCVRDYFHNQSFIQLAKISRKHGQTGMCLEYLNKIKSSAVVMDSFQKLQQQLKCILCYAETLENKDTTKMIQVLSHAFNLICHTDKSYFTEEMCAKIHTFEGVILSILNCGVPSTNFENSVIKHENSFKTWSSWGEFLEKCFTSKRFGIQEGEAAITYLLKSCQYANQIQSLKPISKVLWLLSYDQNSRLAATVMKYGKDIPPLHWLPWLPQLFSALSSHERSYISEIIEYVGWTYPQSVYFPLQSLITSLELDAKSIESAGSLCEVFPQALHLQLNICIQLFELLKRKHFKVFSTLRQISDQIEQLGEDVLDKMLKKLKHVLASCYSRAFDSIRDESTTEDLNKVGHLLNQLLSELKRSKTSETINGFSFHHIQQVIRDPVVEKLQSQFIAEFNH